MNIFVLDIDPVKAAQAMDCVRVPKMVTESAQMMASALRRHGATDDDMPLLYLLNITRDSTKSTPVLDQSVTWYSCLITLVTHYLMVFLHHLLRLCLTNTKMMMW
jgi:hypothetical protein